jgi:hypothetical protein
MPTLATLRGAIYDIVRAGLPSDKTIVQRYFRLSTSDAQMRAQMQLAGQADADKRIDAWFVSLDDTDVGITKRYPANHEHLTWMFALYGWLTVNDADNTEEIFDTRVEAVLNALRAAKKLNRNDVIEAGPAQWVAGGYRRVPPETGTLCHFAHLRFKVHVQSEP